MSLLVPVCFVAGTAGTYSIVAQRAVRGEPLPPATHLNVVQSLTAGRQEGSEYWTLRGTTGHLRYTEQREKQALTPVSPPLGRSEATCATLIPIRKSAAWWDLAQDERRAIFEARSRHIEIGLRYLPAIARRLYQARELGEPFDFLTWFEYAPENTAAFEELLHALRESEEWTYVEREIDVRLAR